MTANLNIGGLYEVEWTDTTNIADWIDRAELEDFAKNGAFRCFNVGWLQYQDDSCIVLSGRYTIDGKHFGLTERIPRSSIESTRQLWNEQ